ncbi:MAG: HAD family hydrolase, partial [Oscillospiraceae bacterium]|nr:HAD family hydrolase [Oscillospiraceae bacterium]
MKERIWNFVKYKTYIFDFDYTLADATAGIVESINYGLNCAGLKSESVDTIKKTVGMALKDALFELTKVSDEYTIEIFTAHFKHMADRVMADCTVLLPDTVSVLSALKQNGCNTAILTNKFHYRIDEVLKKYKITELIDFIVGFEDVAVAKPSPEGLLKAIKFFGVDKQSVLYIGDNQIDANTAFGAGVDFAAVLTGTTEKQ